MTHNIRLDRTTRLKAIEAGLWQRTDGTLIRIDAMPDPYLVNAWLKALSEGDPLIVTSALAAEVVRRGLEDYAAKVAEEREHRS